MVLAFTATSVCVSVSLYIECVLGSFSHSTESIRERPNLTKTKLCPTVELDGTCNSMSECPYAHTLLELRATPMLFRTVMCSWWKKGQCEFGDSCRFAHGDTELRESSSVADSSPTHQAAVNTPQNDGAFSHYPAVFAAALAAATQAAALVVFTPQQAMALSAAASAAALEAISKLTPPVPSQTFMKKGFASSPALLDFFDDGEDDKQETRGRAGSDPGLNTDAFLEELRKLWIEPAQPEIPLMRSDPYLSASHMTLDSYQINID